MLFSESISRRRDLSVPPIVSRSRMILSRVLQFSLWLFGISLFIWALRDPRFRDAEGFVKGEFCLPVAVSIALLIFGSAVTGTLKRFAFWFSLAIVGQAVALQMIEAGPLIHYQHYKRLSRLVTENPLLLIYLAAQTTLVLAGFRTRWGKIQAWIGRTLNVWQIVGLSLVFFVSGAAMSREIRFYVAELFFAAFVQLVNLANIMLMAWAIPENAVAGLGQRFQKLFGRAEEEEGGEPGRLDRFAVSAALWVTMLAAVLSVVSYERHPHVQDEVVYLYHARYLASGLLTLPRPPVPEAFDTYLMEVDKDRWYASPPPGWPLALAVGVLFGVPWLVNPVLAGLNVLLAYILVRELYGRRIARWVAVLMCISPWHVFMAMNFMTHTFTLTCALVAAIGVAWSGRTGKARWAWLGGSAVGMVSLIRPLDGVIVAGVLGLWAIGVGGRRLKLPSLAALMLGSMIVGAMVLPYNKLLTGNSTVFPITAYTDRHFGPKTNALGFGRDRGLGWPLQPFPGHSPLGAMVNANLNAFSLNTELFGWSMGSLLLMSLLLFSRTMRRTDHLMLTVIAAVFGLHFFYWYSGGPDFGARYWYLMLIPLVVLTARGIYFLKGTLESGPAGSDMRGARVTLAVLSLCAITLLTYFPWRAIDKYHHYLRMRPDVRYLATEYGFGRSLVLIRGEEHPDYESAAAYNPLDLRADLPIYAWDRNDKVRTQVLKAYSDRPVWIIDGPSVTHTGFKVVKGPVSAQELLATENLDR